MAQKSNGPTYKTLTNYCIEMVGKGGRVTQKVGGMGKGHPDGVYRPEIS